MTMKHAYLSASASHRWLMCPPSAKLCAQEEDRGSPYAQQGTDAHALCEYLLNTALGRDCRDPTGDLTWYDGEMQEAAEGYRDFVMTQIQEAKKLCPDPMVCVEQVLDFSKWVTHGFGTGDCVIIADGLLHVIDFKYGLGVMVEAEDNPQLKLYALGALDTFGCLYDIQRMARPSADASAPRMISPIWTMTMMMMTISWINPNAGTPGQDARRPGKTQ